MLIYKRGLGGTQGLARLLNENEHVITQQAISGYIRGKSKASTAFANALAERLGLTRKEKEELAWAFTFGQDVDRSA